MIFVSNVIHEWHNFSHLDNATEEIIRYADHDEQNVINYLKSIEHLPLTWEDSVTLVNDIWEEVLQHLASERPVILKRKDVKVKIGKGAKPSDCHNVAKRLKEENPTWKWMIGFSAIEEACVSSCEWHLHSFLIDEQGRIIEPTPLKRDIYTGLEINQASIDVMFKETNITKITNNSHSRGMTGVFKIMEV